MGERERLASTQDQRGRERGTGRHARERPARESEGPVGGRAKDERERGPAGERASK